MIKIGANGSEECMCIMCMLYTKHLFVPRNGSIQIPSMNPVSHNLHNQLYYKQEERTIPWTRTDRISWSMSLYSYT